MSDGEPSAKNVLVLNSTFVPINIASWRRAIKLIFNGKAVTVEKNGHLINGKFDLPLIIKLNKYVPLPYSRIVLSRKNIYLRDNHTCQYCGKVGGNMTIDHVVPKSRGGGDGWDNLVTCCPRCNSKKGDQTIEAAGMFLKRSPYKPPSGLYLHMTRLRSVPAGWYSYFFKNN